MVLKILLKRTLREESLLNTLHIAICENNKMELTHIFELLKKIKIPVTSDHYSYGEDLLKNYSPNKYDLVLMDIYLDGLTGIEIIHELRKIDSSILIAFITSSLDHTLESYRLGAIKYLEKPLQISDLHNLLQFSLITKNAMPKLVIKISNTQKEIVLSKICFIEQKAWRYSINLSDHTVIDATGKITDIENQLDSSQFIHCHKSYIVNLDFVKHIDSDLMIFELTTGSNIHIRRSSFREVKRLYEQYLFAKTRGHII